MNNKIKILAGFILFSIISLSMAYGQNDKSPIDEKFKSDTTHFTVYSYESTERAIELSYELEKLYAFYTKFFEITSPRKTSLSVTLFQTKENMNITLQKEKAGEYKAEKNGNFFLSISTPYQDRAQLYLVSGNSPLHTKLFNAYIFLLFYETQFPHTSPWIKEGLTAYFSMLEYYPEQGSHFVTPNFNTMEKLQKEIRKGSTYPLSEIISATKLPSTQQEYESFRIASWGLIQYIFNKGEDVTVDKLLVYIKMSNSKPPGYEEFPVFINQTLYEKCLEYINEMESPSKLIESAISQYQEGKYNKASEILDRASKLSNHYYISYYRGLISYKKKDYKEALSYFEVSNKAGLPEALSSYCEGLCYWNLKEKIYGEKLLRKAAKLDAKKFKKPVEAILGTK